MVLVPQGSFADYVHEWLVRAYGGRASMVSLQLTRLVAGIRMHSVDDVRVRTKHGLDGPGGPPAAASESAFAGLRATAPADAAAPHSANEPREVHPLAAQSAPELM